MSEAAPAGTTPRLDPRLAALFVLSGASGLVFEVIWVRQLGNWVGHSTVAVSLVVAAFLTGLLIGSYFGGRSADRCPRPLMRYAQLEALTGLAALAVSLALTRTHALSMALGGSAPAWLFSQWFRQVSAFLVLLPPTALMGATLPTLVRHVASRRADVAPSLGRLYALNTLGAALGCGFAGYYALGHFGLRNTAIGASLGNLAVALLAAHRAGHEGPVAASVEGEPGPAATPVEGLGRAQPGLIAALSGASAIGCELLWFRGLHAFVKSSTYAFSLLLVVYLAGLVLGGWRFARVVGRRREGWRWLAELQLLVAAATLGSVALLGRAGTLVALFGRALGAHGDTDSDLLHALLGLVIVAPPATLMGMSYPLVSSLATERRSLGSLGAALGSVGALNTLGGALGSVLTTLVLVPRLGLQGAFTVMVGLSLAAALVAAWRGGALPATARMAAAIAAGLFLLPRDYLLRATTTFPRASVVAVREGRDGTAAVLSYTRASVCAASPNRCVQHCRRDFKYDQLLFGTISYASTIPPARRYMRALAHLPMLLAPRGAPLDVLEICFGTGTTAGAFTTHPQLRSLTVVDINADVFALSRYFAESNLGVASRPRVRLVAEDGRHHLVTRRQRYDVVSLEPPPPTAEGAASLYTTEFYEAVRRAAGARWVAQWIPLDQQSVAVNRAMLASMRAVYPYVELYIPARLEGVVIASDRPLTPSLGLWREAWRTPAVRDNLAEVGFARPEHLLATRVLDAAGVDRFVAGAAPITDDRPMVEFYRNAGGEAFRARHIPSWADPLAGLSAADRAAVSPLLAGQRESLNAWDLNLDGAHPEAMAAARRAREALGADVYTDFLVELEHDCLALDAP